MKTISIGRDEQCNIVIVDRTNVVSRKHAIIMIDSYGKMTITDYSSNGTYINGIKMSTNVAVPISRKDVISFAHVADLDWRLVPNVRGKLIKLVSIIGVCVVAVGVTLGIVLGGEDDLIPQTPVNNPHVVAADTVKNAYKSENDYQAKQDTIKKDTEKDNAESKETDVKEGKEDKEDVKKDTKKDSKKDSKKDTGKGQSKDADEDNTAIIM